MANDKLRTHHNQLEFQALKKKELEEKLNQKPDTAPVSEMRDKDQEIESLQRQIAIFENRNVPQENLISLEDVNLEFVEGETPEERKERRNQRHRQPPHRSTQVEEQQTGEEDRRARARVRIAPTRGIDSQPRPHKH